MSCYLFSARQIHDASLVVYLRAGYFCFPCDMKYSFSYFVTRGLLHRTLMTYVKFLHVILKKMSSLWKFDLKWGDYFLTHTTHGYYNDCTLKCMAYHKLSDIIRTLEGNKILDHSDVVRASPVDAAPTTSSSSTLHIASIDCTKTTARRDEQHLSFWIWCVLY